MAIPCMASCIFGPQGTRPRPGFKPNKPQQAAGIRIDPPPSLAPAKGTTPAATIAAEPPDEPPGVWFTFQGLRVAPHVSGSVMPLMANSGVLVRPKITKPALRQRFTSSESCAAILLIRFKPALPM